MAASAFRLFYFCRCLECLRTVMAARSSALRRVAKPRAFSSGASAPTCASCLSRSSNALSCDCFARSSLSRASCSKGLSHLFLVLCQRFLLPLDLAFLLFRAAVEITQGVLDAGHRLSHNKSNKLFKCQAMRRSRQAA